jgi:cellobiose-specific phosphotransferase system component IIB
MLNQGNFFRRVTDDNECENKKSFVACVNKKRNVKPTVLPQAEAKESTQNVSFPWPRLEAALSLFKVSFIIKKTKELITKKNTVVNTISRALYVKMSILKKSCQ